MHDDALLNQTSNRPHPNYKWWVVGMLWFICFFNYADRMAINAVKPILQHDYGFTNEQFGYIASAFMWVYALTAPIAGQVGDKFHRKSLILGGLLVWSVVTGATGFCRKLWQFVTVRATEGLGETFYFPATMSLVSDYHTKRTRSRAMGLHQTSVYAGTIGGTTLAGYLAQTYGWQSPFLFFGILGVMLALVLAIFLREPGRNEAERLESGVLESAPPSATVPLSDFLRQLATTPSAVLLLIAFVGANTVGLIFITWMPGYLYEHFGQNLMMSGFRSTFYLQTASAIGSVIGGSLADRLRKHVAGGRILTQSHGAFLGVPFIFLAGSTTNVDQLTWYLTFFGLAKGIYDANIWASMYDVIHPSRRATTLGFANMIGWAGAGGGVNIIGYVTTPENGWNVTMGQALASTAVVYACVAVLLLLAGTVFARRDIKRAADVAATEAAAETITDEI